MEMGSRLRPVPDCILECVIEVSAPSNNHDATLVSYYPETYEDVNMLQDVVPKFCFPFEQDAEMVDAVQHFTFVLTDIDGLYRFGFCRYPPKAKTCLCILSDLPAFEMFYTMLNILAELEKNAGTESLTVKQFVDLVLESEVPIPGGQLTIAVPGKNWTRQFNYPDAEKLPTIPENRNLTDYFSAVNPNNMIALFASMMCERRIIITSKRLSLLTACTYSASSLLYPMHWQHVFIPVIPPTLLDYCCAPMPFLVGVHSSLMKRVRDMPLDDVVILDVDKNEMELPFNDVDDLPSEAVHKLNSALKKNTITIGDCVSKAFLSAVVVLIGGYRDALRLSSETIIFERELFVNSRPHMKPFLEKLLTFQLFERFVHHRLERLNTGEGFDDVFEEQVGLQTESNSKWATQYKQWLKNRKRDGSQLLSSISGKTEKATYKANKFFQTGFKNMKNHGKYGWKEAVKGLKEKKNNLIEYVKGKEVELSKYDDNSNNTGLKKSNSLPMRKACEVKKPPVPSRKSVGASVNTLILADPPPVPKRTTCPSKPPPRAPPRPPPYKFPPSADHVSPGKLRKSMHRDPNDPPVKDLIDFFDGQEELNVAKTTDPFAEFQDYNYEAKHQQKQPSQDATVVKSEEPSDGSDSTKEGKQDLLWETMVSLSDDARQFLRDSRNEGSRISESSPLKNGQVESVELQKKEPVRKTLRELALDHRNKNHSLTHSGSCPSLFEPLASTNHVENSLRNASPSNIRKTCVNNVSSNVDLLVQLDDPPSCTDREDTFVELITQRHSTKLAGLNMSDTNQRSEDISISPWVADFN